MSKKAILTTFIAAIVIVVIVGSLSYLMAKNRPSADVLTPPVPPVPSGAPNDYPPVPSIPRLKGDANNDGIVNVLDLSAIVSNWQTVDPVHNLVDDKNGTANMINALDLSQVITYWNCTEAKVAAGTGGCAYYSYVAATPTATAIIPPPIPTLPPAKTVTATAGATATVTSGITVSINKGETKAITGYPFSIQYWRSAVSIYSLVIKPTATSGTCRVTYPIFYSSNPNKTYTCNGVVYNIFFDFAKSSSASVTVSVSKSSASSGSSGTGSGGASSSYTRTPISQIRTIVPVKTRTSGSPSSGGSSSSN